MPTTPTKTPRDIAMAAYQYLISVTAPGQSITTVRLEELKPITGSDDWSVVLSYDTIGEYVFEKKREYKEFIVDNKAVVKSMAIKNI